MITAEPVAMPGGKLECEIGQAGSNDRAISTSQMRLLPSALRRTPEQLLDVEVGTEDCVRGDFVMFQY